MNEKYISKEIEEQNKIDIYKAIIAACEKQIPKKVCDKAVTMLIDGKETATETMHFCPACGWCASDTGGSKDKYCSECGQRLEW